MLTYQEILEIVTSFYAKATNDILIGYHFRNIENFDTHLPRIADFWELQLTGNITHKESLPFELFKVHQKLMIKKAQVRRWVILFQESLAEFKHIDHNENEGKKIAMLNLWEEKIQHFQEKFLHNASLYQNTK